MDDLFAVELEMHLKSEETGEERTERRREHAMKCNITIDVNHLAEGFKVALAEERELRSDVAGRDVVFKGPTGSWGLTALASGLEAAAQAMCGAAAARGRG